MDSRGVFCARIWPVPPEGSATKGTSACTASRGGLLTTAWIERLNATFRARLCALVRRGHAPACQPPTLHQATYLTGTVYTFCTLHRTLSERAHAAHPSAMAAAITARRRTVEELLASRVAPGRWAPPNRRGRPSRQLQALIARWPA